MLRPTWQPAHSCHCLSCLPVYLLLFSSLFLSGFLSLYVHLWIWPPVSLFPSSPSLHPLPPFIIWLCVDCESCSLTSAHTHAQHGADTTNLRIISARIISSRLLGWWNGGDTEGERKIRVMGSVTSPGHADTFYETNSSFIGFTGFQLW